MLRDDTEAAKRELANDKAYQANKRAAEIVALDELQTAKEMALKEIGN